MKNTNFNNTKLEYKQFFNNQENQHSDDEKYLHIVGKLMKSLQDLGIKKPIGQITIGDLLGIVRKIQKIR